jgi:hypothetical protein
MESLIINLISKYGTIKPKRSPIITMPPGRPHKAASLLLFCNTATPQSQSASAGRRNSTISGLTVYPYWKPEQATRKASWR